MDAKTKFVQISYGCRYIFGCHNDYDKYEQVFKGGQAVRLVASRARSEILSKMIEIHNDET